MPVIIRGLSGLSKKIKDATAAPQDIISGKVAYGNDNTRMVGTHVCRKTAIVGIKQGDVYDNLKNPYSKNSWGFQVLEQIKGNNVFSFWALAGKHNMKSIAFILPKSESSATGNNPLPFKYVSVNADITNFPVLEVTVKQQNQICKRTFALANNTDEVLDGYFYALIKGLDDYMINAGTQFTNGTGASGDLLFTAKIESNIIKQIGFTSDPSSNTGDFVKTVSGFDADVEIKLSWT